jgi:hypothetical protein
MIKNIPFVAPKSIPSPYSGQITKPRIIERQIGNNLMKEAQWICPASGNIFHRGIVSVEEVKKTK